VGLKGHLALRKRLRRGRKRVMAPGPASFSQNLSVPTRIFLARIPAPQLRHEEGKQRRKEWEESMGWERRRKGRVFYFAGKGRAWREGRRRPRGRGPKRRRLPDIGRKAATL